MYFSANDFYTAARRGQVFISRPVPDTYYSQRNISRENFFRAYGYTPSVTVSPDKVTKRMAAKYLREAKKALLNRTFRTPTGTHIASKWVRPWAIVPKLVHWTPPSGDYGVGIEIEMGFTSRQSAAFIADRCKHMRNVTADNEGGTYPIEMTFPPVRYSKITNKTNFIRYLKILNDNSSRVVAHGESAMVGTHVNVSLPEDITGAEYQRISERLTTHIHNELRGMRSHIDQNRKYFGRIPYGYIYKGDNNRRFFEFKLFNSTLDINQFKRYIHIAVSLVELAKSHELITRNSVLTALERGYNKKSFKL